MSVSPRRSSTAYAWAIFLSSFIESFSSGNSTIVSLSETFKFCDMNRLVSSNFSQILSLLVLF